MLDHEVVSTQLWQKKIRQAEEATQRAYQRVQEGEQGRVEAEKADQRAMTLDEKKAALVLLKKAAAVIEEAEQTVAQLGLQVAKCVKQEAIVQQRAERLRSGSLLQWVFHSLVEGACWGVHVFRLSRW